MQFNMEMVKQNVYWQGILYEHDYTYKDKKDFN